MYDIIMQRRTYRTIKIYETKVILPSGKRLQLYVLQKNYVKSEKIIKKMYFWPNDPTYEGKGFITYI